MTSMPGMAEMPATANPAGLFAMWAVMMAAMMLPGALPLIRARGGLFAAGYLVVWTGFSAAATLIQWELDRAGALSGTMALRSVPLAALIVAGAGAYQLTPFKLTCLARCREHAALRTGTSRQSRWRAVADGIRYGGACLGCCWALMALLFVFGVMNVLWIVAIAAFVLVEKLIPRGAGLSRFAGVALVATGVIMRFHVAS